MKLHYQQMELKQLAQKMILHFKLVNKNCKQLHFNIFEFRRDVRIHGDVTKLPEHMSVHMNKNMYICVNSLSKNAFFFFFSLSEINLFQINQYYENCFYLLNWRRNISFIYCRNNNTKCNVKFLIIQYIMHSWTKLLVPIY